MALADYVTLLTSMVPATDPPSSDSRDSAIQLALARYSEDAPQELVRDVVWVADGYFGPLPAEWVAGSVLLATEYPVGQVPPSALEATVYIDTGGSSQLMATEALSDGSTVRVTFTVPHELAGAPTPVDTIPLRHREAVACYAAHVLCRELATYFSNERETSIGADGSNTESRARNFGIRANQYRADYYAGIGKADPQAGRAGGSAASGNSAGAVVSWPSRSRNSLTRSNW